MSGQKIIRDGKSFAAICRTSEYGWENSLLFNSIKANGEELLASPVRIYGEENGRVLDFGTAECFAVERDNETNLCCAAECGNYIIDTSICVENDGCCQIDLKLLPRGKRVTEVFGVEKYKNDDLNLNKLVLEIPLKTETATHYHYWPQETDFSQPVCGSDKLDKDLSLPFKPLLWLGTTERGLCFFSDSDENWQPEPKKAIEVFRREECVLLRLNLLGEKPHGWVRRADENGEEFLPAYGYMPVTFRFGFQATPVKTFPKNPYENKSLHIDCFKKIPGNYRDYLFSEPKDGKDKNYFDRMKRLGVTCLYLHEKWHRIQNSGYYSEDEEKQTDEIVFECKKRGIKVIPYFGYEVSTLSPDWNAAAHDLRKTESMYENGGGWYRNPPQRDYIMCFNSPQADRMADDIAKVVERFGFDGVYLDSALFPVPCLNEAHGCGYEKDGKIHVTYPVTAIRRFMKKLREILPTGALINVHLSNCCMVPAMSFCDGIWDGEFIQTQLNREGIERLPKGLMQAEYTGRNFGVPYEFVAYSLPNWSFENALCLAVPHGILPRPNDADDALSVIAPYWESYVHFPVAQSVWHPYWNSDLPIFSKNDTVKCSFYEYESYEGKHERLLLFGNLSKTPNKATLSGKISYAKCLTDESAAVLCKDGLEIRLKSYGAAVVYAVFG